MAMPPELKPLKRFFKRAEELDRAAAKGENTKLAVVAYFCRSYALQLGLKIHKSMGADAPSSIMSFLLATMDKVEADKKKLPKYDSESAKAVCQQFALSVFKKADDEDRNGLADKGTARTYYAAAVYLDVLLQFGELDEAIKELPIYAKFKATDIIKAIKEGREPTPGPPGGDGSAGPDATLVGGGIGGSGGGGGGVSGVSGDIRENNTAGGEGGVSGGNSSSTGGGGGGGAAFDDSMFVKPPAAPNPAPSVPESAPVSDPGLSSLSSSQGPSWNGSSDPSASNTAANNRSEQSAVKDENIALQMAIEMVKTAIQADNSGDYIQAFSLYKECLGFFMDAIKITSNAETKKTIMSRMEAYMKRAEQLKPIVEKMKARGGK